MLADADNPRTPIRSIRTPLQPTHAFDSLQTQLTPELSQVPTSLVLFTHFITNSWLMSYNKCLHCLHELHIKISIHYLP